MPLHLIDVLTTRGAARLTLDAPLWALVVYWPLPSRAAAPVVSTLSVVDALLRRRPMHTLLKKRRWYRNISPYVLPSNDWSSSHRYSRESCRTRHGEAVGRAGTIRIVSNQHPLVSTGSSSSVYASVSETTEK